MQPRVTPSLPIGREGSLFQRVFSSPNGLDPYAFAVSDVYQDLFEEGSYVGKGIYDVDAFEARSPAACRIRRCSATTCSKASSRAPAWLPMSRSSRNFPRATTSALLRQHRWARGDWQLLPWIFGRGRRHGQGRAHDALPAIGRWKMIDNLRRSLSAPVVVLALLAGWTAAASSRSDLDHFRACGDRLADRFFRSSAGSRRGASVSPSRAICARSAAIFGSH